METAGQERETAELPKREFSPVLKFSAVILLLVVAVGLGWNLWIGASHGYKSIRLYGGHDLATGVVTADIIDDHSTHYEVEINGQIYRDTTSEKFRKGELIEVAYLPNSPTINRPKKSLWDDTVRLGLGIAALTIVLLLFVASKYLSKKETHEE